MARLFWPNGSCLVPWTLAWAAPLVANGQRGRQFRPARLALRSIRSRVAVMCSCKKRGCRRARPLCRRTDSARNLTCGCPAYGWPHRVGSGLCWHGSTGQERMNALAWGSP